MVTQNTRFTFSRRLFNFFNREDKEYDDFCSKHQAKSLSAKVFYLFFHLLPGILAYVVLNIQPVNEFLLTVTGWSNPNFQYIMLIFVTFGWHMLLPLIVLRFADKLSIKESIAFLGLNRIDWKGLLLVLPVIIVVFTIISIPYMAHVNPVLKAWVEAVPALRIPEYSLFLSGLYDFPPLMLLFLFIGNFLGEEVYFRGYLMKKTAFLGKYNWLITSVLFAIYHFWQAPQTWPYVGLVGVFGLTMIWRKNLYVLIVLHVFLNLGWGMIVYSIIGN